jgi:hypothetical protein
MSRIANRNFGFTLARNTAKPIAKASVAMRSELVRLQARRTLSGVAPQPATIKNGTPTRMIRSGSCFGMSSRVVARDSLPDYPCDDVDQDVTAFRAFGLCALGFSGPRAAAPRRKVS